MVEDAASAGFEYPADAIAALSDPSTDKSEEDFKTELYDKYGIEDLETKFKERPEMTFEEIYSDAYSDLELTDLKGDINKLRDKIAKAEEDRDEAIGTINENPWL